MVPGVQGEATLVPRRDQVGEYQGGGGGGGGGGGRGMMHVRVHACGCVYVDVCMWMCERVHAGLRFTNY